MIEKNAHQNEDRKCERLRDFENRLAFVENTDEAAHSI